MVRSKRYKMKTGILENKKYITAPLSSFIVSHWAYINNVNDSVGTNNGTALGTVSFPVINGVQMVDFSAGTTSGISITDANNLSFGDGFADKDFSIDFPLLFNGINNCWFFNKRDQNGTVIEYYIEFLNNKMRFILVDQSVGGYNYTEVDFTPVINTLYHFGFTRVSGVLKTYKNGANIAAPLLTAGGVYKAMENTSSPLYIGRSSGTSWSLNGKMGATTVWRKGLSAAEMADVSNKKLNGISII